ncbi:DUF432 domain-containing protein [Methanoculleus sp. Wushi-C6]|uniref:DUF432 domain-containing protein n=2 Tax=Methanoculleus caldifontis TaxID=2651577 RepID=A0ABU3X3T7_9EURY|nr:DUF432 domain-containing protein [Methanoculleus sp. Wushi-C6]
MFGRYMGSFHREYGDIMVEAERANGLLTYRRRCGEQTFERILVTKTGEMIINPVEPVNLPKEITNYLQVEFSPMVLEPGTTQTVYLKFPVEIGVFLESAKDIEVLDVFANGSQKYTLYGPQTNGVIARYHRSAVYSEIPSVECFCEGVMELSITNASREWVEVSQVVFDSTDMKIYYNDFVTTTATMNIISANLAETDFVDAPLRPGMVKSVELYAARKIPVINRGYLMEWGFT